MAIGIGQASLASLLSKVKGATFATLLCETEPDLIKPKSNPLAGRVKKLSRVNVCLNFHYEKAVNRQLTREGKDADFVVQPRKWGERIQGTPLVEHKGKLYVEAMVQKVYHTHFTLDGKLVDKAKIAEHLRPSSTPQNQGVDKAIIIRDYSLANIRRVHLGGNKINV